MDSFLKLLSFVFERLKNFPSKWRFRANLIRNWTAVGWFIDKATWEFGLPDRRLKPVPLESVFPGITTSAGTIEVERLWDRDPRTSLELGELCVLLSIVKYRGARNILEVGTYDGNSALNLALNLPPEGRVVTVDLPDVETPRLALAAQRSNINPSSMIGRQLKNSEAASKVTLVREDTALLDWKRLPGPFDLIFIDGCHDDAYVKNDTEKSLGVLAEEGILVWHDYNLPGVGKFLDEFTQTRPCSWIQGTRFVVSHPSPLP